MKALFFRKCENEQEYEKLSNNHTEFGELLEYNVIKVVTFITQEEYKLFTTNFLKDDISIKLITNELFMDSTDKVHCAYFTSLGIVDNFLYDYVAFYLATYYKMDAMWECKMEQEINSALCSLCNFEFQRMNYKKIKNILRNKYKLDITNEKPLRIKEL